ncbi:MAG: hypothetical protein ABL997_05450 [Planctomycetota bacterium]
MARSVFFACCAVALGLPACTKAQDPASKSPADAPFDFGHPVATVMLGKSLREISGMIALDDERLACVQDEKGQFYEVRLRDGEVLAKARFGPDGDYEGMCRVPGAWFAVRSDGVLLRVPEVDFALQEPESFSLPLEQRNCEALCVDRDGTQLLVAGKSKPDGDKAARDLRLVHAWNLAEETLEAEPVLTLSVKALLEAAVARSMVTPTKPDSSPPRPRLSLHISELAVQPDTGHIWMLSGAERVLLAVDRSGALVWLHTFPEALLPQPEALAFLPSGDLVVASEGRDGPAVLVRFSRRRPTGTTTK